MTPSYVRVARSMFIMRKVTFAPVFGDRAAMSHVNKQYYCEVTELRMTLHTRRSTVLFSELSTFD